MYTPAHFAQPNASLLLDFMRRYPFATLVTTQGGRPTATHLPFLIEKRGEQIVLSAHLSRANPQWQSFEEGEALVIFQEPHAYVSPRFYEKEENVPTWNYVAIHAYGRVQVLPDEAATAAQLEQLIQANEPAYQLQWQSLDETYKRRLLRGIVAFEMVVTDLQGKDKLSQNKTEQERANIIAGLSASPHATERDLAGIMQQREELSRH